MMLLYYPLIKEKQGDYVSQHNRPNKTKLNYFANKYYFYLFAPLLFCHARIVIITPFSSLFSSSIKLFGFIRERFL